MNVRRIMPPARALLYDGTNKRELFEFTNTNYRDVKSRLHLSGTEEDYLNNSSTDIKFIYKNVMYGAYAGNVICIEDGILYLYNSLSAFRSIFTEV